VYKVTGPNIPTLKEHPAPFSVSRRFL